MGAALRRQRDAGRRADDHEARVLVARVAERVEPAQYEWIVDRPDRQQARAEQRRRQAQRGEHDEEVVLGDAELEVLAGR
jgi:hypothetical protein